MKYMNKLIFTFFVLVFVSGCNSPRDIALNDFLDQFNKEVIEGKTTKAEILEIFGSPDTVSLTDQGLEIYIYTNTESHIEIGSKILIFKKKQAKKKELHISFNKESTVKKIITY